MSWLVSRDISFPALPTWCSAGVVSEHLWEVGMTLLLVSVVGCSWFESLEEDLTTRVADQGIAALDDARTVVKAAGDSPGKRRVLKMLRRLESDIKSGKRTGLNGNVVAEIVKRVANDGTISGIEAGAVEDAYRAIIDDDLKKRKRGKRKSGDDQPPETPEPS